MLLHAVTDALLGAAALGDIGELFPDTDPANRGRDSGEMLQAAWRKVAAAGFRSRERRLHRVRRAAETVAVQGQRFAERIAELLDVGAISVGVKAKTGETVGPVGRQEAIVAECVVLLEQTEST